MIHLALIAHDIRSRENVGSLFRTCDSLGVKKLWLTGYTPAPPDLKISKVALGAERSVAFEKMTDVVTLIHQLKKEGMMIFALELTDDAQDLATFQPPKKMALLLGTETSGIPPSLLELCDGTIKIEQRGIKESLNVSVAAGIAAWGILR
ncbi:MAG: TrmH family RNA methyltransferase [Candidatus Uhrbacteria bacterium]|nr:TrmH family RNA methyltransferase [Candidatus Uhrbacteria bacterium]MDP3793372.1 TrmH family RNA methyltransferase [Candidatus Uhrbacteria bacterium]